MKAMFSSWLLGAASFMVVTLLAASGHAQTPYPTPGVQNLVTYSFTATTTGDIVAYFCGPGAYCGPWRVGSDDQLGLLVNGVDTGIIGLDNQTSNEGDELNFGTVQAGAVLTFYMIVADSYLGGAQETYYSNPS